MNYENVSAVFKALSDPNRIMILEILQSGEKCACKLLNSLSIGQPTLSHHMKILCDSGFITCRRSGKWMYYSINNQGFDMAKNLLTEIMLVKVMDC